MKYYKKKRDLLIYTLAYNFYEWDPCIFQKIDQNICPGRQRLFSFNRHSNCLPVHGLC